MISDTRLDGKRGQVTWATPKGSEIEQVILRSAGRNNTQAIIGYVRRRTGLEEKLKALQAEDPVSIAKGTAETGGPSNVQ